MENELYHHGVKGMKWGVRRYRNKDGSLTAEGKRHQARKTKGWSKDAKKVNTIKRKNVHQMTNQELQALNKRQDLEKHYRQNNPHRVATGMKVVATVAGGMGTVAALYNNSSQLIKIGKKVVGSFAKNS